ncbi:zinc finger protein 624 [Aedes aegypti]|uniref:Uncharacterized protein n=2 Tax=Aedes aegypti TaxID=7159 RepID=A0A1S4G0S0_AEDAE|nr:zinc finger protein 624 [Aedes aegypti]
MSSVIVTTDKPEGFKCFQQFCRLCLGEESLEDIFSETGLNQLISELLSVQISHEDQLGHAICAICRLRIVEFRQYRARCQEVQGVLQSTAQNLSGGMDKDSTTESVEKNHMPFESREIKTEVCEEELGFVIETDQAEVGLKTRVETPDTIVNYSHDQLGLLLLSDCTELSHDNEEDHQRIPSTEVEYAQMVGIKDEIDIEPVKIVCTDIDAGITNNCKNTLSSETISPVTSQIQKARTPQSMQCKTCNKILKSEHRLVVHERRVHGPKKYNCDVCEHSFLLPRDLRRHELSKQHLKYMAFGGRSAAHGKKIWQCKECEKSFRDNKHLQSHMKIHGPKMFECQICGRPCTLPGQLKRHMLTHDPNRTRRPVRERVNAAAGPFACDICQKEFRTRCTLGWHKKQVHGPKSYECHICDSKFTTRYILLEHIKRHYRHEEKK